MSGDVFATGSEGIPGFSCCSNWLRESNHCLIISVLVWSQFINCVPNLRLHVVSCKFDKALGMWKRWCKSFLTHRQFNDLQSEAFGPFFQKQALMQELNAWMGAHTKNKKLTHLNSEMSILWSQVFLVVWSAVQKLCWRDPLRLNPRTAAKLETE